MTGRYGTELPPTLVTGASGFLGLAVVRALASAGASVVGLVRTREKARQVEAAGARAELGDVLDARAVLRAAQGSTAFVHLASAANDPSVPPEVADRIRVDGTRHLVRAAGDLRGRRLVVGSGYWVYPSTPGLIDERSAVAPAGESVANYDAEQVARRASEASDLTSCAVRPAMVYGNGAWLPPMVAAIRGGTYHLIEGGTNSWSFVDRTDAAEAFVRVVADGTNGEVYNVADGRPVTWGEFARFVASELGAPAPGNWSKDEAESAYGPVIATHLAASRAMGNERLRRLGWAPTAPDFRVGLPPVLAQLR